MIVKLRDLSGKDHEVDVDDDTDVETLKALTVSIHPDLGEDPEALKLLFKGKRLTEGTQTLKDLSVKENDVINMIISKKPAAASPAAAPAPASQAGYAAPIAPPTASGGIGPPPEAVVAMLTSMGFPRDRVIAAMQMAFNDGDRAVQYLLSGTLPPAPDADTPAFPAGASATEGANWAEAMFGPQLLTKAGLKTTNEALNKPSVVLIYFSAHWCPPCRAFTPQLAKAFNALGETQQAVQVIFVSGDREALEFQQYFADMPWFAVPFGVPQIQPLKIRFNVTGIPFLVALNGQTGAVLDANARDSVGRSGFDLAGCCRSWGVNLPDCSSQTALQAAAAPRASQGPKWPEVVKIDQAEAKATVLRMEEIEESKQIVFRDTLIKLLENVMNGPDEPKFRTIKKNNKALNERIFSEPEGAAVVLLTLAGFEDGEDIVLPGPPDGRCHAVWEILKRSARDMNLAKVREEEKKRPLDRSFGGDGGRHQLGTDRRRSGGG